MAKREAPSRRLAKPDGAAEKAPSRSNNMQNTQAPRKRQPLIRNDVIRCEKCGEDYSVTYKRCPFCDERPGRPGVGVQKAVQFLIGHTSTPISSKFLRRCSLARWAIWDM